MAIRHVVIVPVIAAPARPSAGCVGTIHP
jgi:hypothetical protein